MTLSPATAAWTESVGRDASRRAARALLFGRGDLGWALHPLQHKARATLADAYSRGVRRGVLLVGRRGGKTRLCMVDAFEAALKNPGWRIPYAALTWKSATGFVFPEAEYLSSFAPAAIRPAIVDGEVRFAPAGIGVAGSKLVVKGSDTKKKADDLRGPSAPRGYIDECGFNPVLDYITKSVLAPQLLTTRGMMIMSSSVPDSPAHPFIGYVEEARARRALVTYRTRDAPHVTAEALAELAQELGGEQSIEYRRECDCEIVTDSRRAVIPEWYEHVDAVVPELTTDDEPEWWPETPPHRHWYIGADLGFVDLTVVLLAWWDWDNARLVVEDERVLVRPTSHDVQRATAEMVAERVAAGRERIVSRVADAPLITIADMDRLQPPDERARWTPARKDDREAAVNAVRLMVARHQIVIHPRCSTLVAHCGAAIWNTQRTDYERSGSDGMGHFDALAALVYLVRSVDRARSPYPPGFGAVSNAEHWVPKPTKPAQRVGGGKRRL